MQELGSNEASASVLGNHGHEKERSCVPCIADGAGLSGWPWPRGPGQRMPRLSVQVCISVRRPCWQM